MSRCFCHGAIEATLLRPVGITKDGAQKLIDSNAVVPTLLYCRGPWHCEACSSLDTTGVGASLFPVSEGAHSYFACTYTVEPCNSGEL